MDFEKPEPLNEIAAHDEANMIVFKAFQVGNKYFNDTADGLLWIMTLGARPNEDDNTNRD